MESLHSESPIANIDDGIESVEAARASLTKAGVALVERAAEIGLAENVAALYRNDPLEAEGAVRDMVFGMARSILADAFAALEDHGPSLQVDDRTYRKAEVTPGRAMTMFGPVDFLRSRYRPSGTGASLVPAEAVLGLTACGLTPAAAGLSMYLMSGLTARESEDAWRRLCGQGPSTASLVRLSGEVGTRMEECSGALLAGLREREEMPAEAVSLLVSLDGVMMRMNAETADGKPTDAGWREASCGVVALVDAEGNMLESRVFGRLPEAGKTSLKSQLKAEAFHWLKLNPDLKLAVAADAAPDNWTFLESLSPDVTLVDFWHAAQHIKVAADAAFGADTAAGTAWFEKWRHVLRHDSKGVGKVVDALRHLLRKRKGAEDVRRELAFFRNNRRRMYYADAAKAGYAIGSGAVESANKVLVTSRMKRSGQSWGRDGGQGVLTFRSLLKSGRFDRAWAVLAPRLSRNGDWKPPQCANDNRPVVRIALAA